MTIDDDLWSLINSDSIGHDSWLLARHQVQVFTTSDQFFCDRPRPLTPQVGENSRQLFEELHRLHLFMLNAMKPELVGGLEHEFYFSISWE